MKPNETALECGLSRRAINAHNVVSASKALGKRLLGVFWDPRQSLPDLSDHLARDIGVSQADLEWQRFRLPSQTSHHPRG